MKSWWIAKIVKMLVIGAVALFVLGFGVMWLWNALIPELFKGPVLSFWQAIGLLALSHVLLRGWGRWHYAGGWKQDRWKKKLEEKLAAMTPEERATFKEDWRRRCGFYPGEFEKKEEPT